MSKLRISLATCFALFTLVFIWVDGKLLLKYCRAVSLRAPLPILLSKLLVVVLATIFAILFGAAWWTILKDYAQPPSAATAACTALISADSSPGLLSTESRIGDTPAIAKKTPPRSRTP